MSHFKYPSSVDLKLRAAWISFINGRRSMAFRNTQTLSVVWSLMSGSWAPDDDLTRIALVRWTVDTIAHVKTPTTEVKT